MENAFFDVKKELRKGYFRSSAEKGRGPDPKSPLIARLDLIWL